MSLLRANYNSPGGSERCQAVCGNSEILLSVLCQLGSQRKAGGAAAGGAAAGGAVSSSNHAQDGEF